MVRKDLFDGPVSLNLMQATDHDPICLLQKYIVGYPSPASWIVENIKRAQDYLVNETRLGIPAIVQSEGMSIQSLRFITTPDLIEKYRNPRLLVTECNHLQLANRICLCVESHCMILSSSKAFSLIGSSNLEVLSWFKIWPES